MGFGAPRSPQQVQANGPEETKTMQPSFLGKGLQVKLRNIANTTALP
jgi:hypothetical protein